MHIGLIGGIGPAATVFYYERIVRGFADADRPLDLTIAHTSARTLSKNAASGNATEQVVEYQRVTRQLAAAGADVVVITSMGGHFCAREFAAVSPLPLIAGPEAVAAHLRERGPRRIGILGTRVVMETRLYGALEDLEPIVPAGDALTRVNDDYVTMAIAGTPTPGQRDRLLAAARTLVQEQGAEGILLGGTDLNLIFDPAALEFPVIDSAAVHVDAIVAKALGDARVR